MSQTSEQRVSRALSRLLQAGVSGSAFPGATASVAWREEGRWHFSTTGAGKLGLGPWATLGRVGPNTIYDLASLTKPFVATAAMRLVELGKLKLEDKLSDLCPDIKGEPGEIASLEELLSHRSELDAWGGLYLDVPHERGTSAARRWILNAAARRPRTEQAGEPAGNRVALYSDLGYMLAGEMIARSCNASLATVVDEQVLQPLGLRAQIGFAGAMPGDRRGALVSSCAPTERCDWRGTLVRGQVHDENCAALGGVSGHAGLFGDAESVTQFGTAILDVLGERSAYLDRATLVECLRVRPGGGYRMGWDGRNGQGSAAGRMMSPQTFGHLGFTGTSLWCDPEAEVVITLLSNRVHPSRANAKIKGFRPAFHDGVMAALGPRKSQ